MRHFVAILAALTLTECALPGASGTSFMSSMHPTQEFCASRGMTLDATTKQCVTPPQPARVTADVTGSLPDGAGWTITTGYIKGTRAYGIPIHTSDRSGSAAARRTSGQATAAS
jgi:hypothetical protein